jgi:cytochrome P450
VSFIHDMCDINSSKLRVPALVDRDHSDLKTRPALRLSAEEVAAQTAILLIAGQEITVAALLHDRGTF